MANSDVPSGLSPVRTVSGQVYTGAARTYYIAADNPTVLMVGDGALITGTSDANGVPGIVRSTGGSGNYTTGSIVGFLPAYPGATSAPNLNIIYWPALTAGYAMVCDDQDMLYEIQCSGSISATDIGSNANFTYATPGNTLTGMSGLELDSTSFGTGATKQARVVEVAQLPDNALGTNCKVLVKLNLSSLTNTTGV